MLNTRLWVVGLVMIGTLFGVPTISGAHSSSEESGAGRVPIPVHPEGRGERCVEDTQFMRRNHMKLILHKRNLTMRQGIRTTEHSLKECVRCHAAQNADGSYIPVDAPDQFCRSCHSYAGIQPDCFECHATTPATPPAIKP